MKNLLLMLLATVICSCDHGDQLSEKIIGKWKMLKVYEGDQDITTRHNPENDRYIILGEDGRFESGGSPYGKNTGTYNLDNAKRTIFIDSDAGEGDDSKWSIYFAGDSMMWRGVGSERQENTRLVHIKVE